MAVLALIVKLVAMSTLPILSNAAEDIQVSISTPTESVTVGGILAISCQVWNLKPDYTVHIFRELETRTEMITNGDYIARTAESLNAFLATRTFLDGSSVYFLTMLGVSDDDQGEYFCKVADLSLFTAITEDSVHVKIYSFPSGMYPLCSSTPNQLLTLRMHETVTLKCTSEKGVPTIRMKWMNNKSARYITDQNRTDGNLVHSEAILLIDDSLNGAVFSCEITSNGFPDWKRTCNIGPITVQPGQPMNGNYGVTTKVVSGNAGNREQNDILKPRLTEACGACSSDDDMLQFYLTVATIGTGFLTIIFLTSTIVLCYKYHHISPVTRREPLRVLTPQQSIEPVYVSLQRRSVNADREYMTLEDPNNPDNKILLPKETFDDYCRTMSLKRV